MPPSAGTAACKVSVRPALPASTAPVSSLRGGAVCLFVFLLVVGVFAGNCISTRTSADTAMVEGRAISLHLWTDNLSRQNFSNVDQASALGSKKISYPGLKSHLN